MSRSAWRHQQRDEPTRWSLILVKRAAVISFSRFIAGLSEGVILIEPGQRIIWGNEAALAMHGVESLEDLGATVDAYRRRFRLRYRNNHILKNWTIRSRG